MAAESIRWWSALAPRARAGLAAGAFAIVACVAGGGYFLLRPDYRVLFSELAPEDAAAMVAELDALKVPYRLGDGETTILVPADLVHTTRLKVMGKELPLRGAVGFEIFNNNDFGMTEFAQKVNYQRALQGELTRTIMAVDGVQFARVHLAIPEQGLFRKGDAKAKASITIAMKRGRSLHPEQVAGIQRLVAAALPDIAPQDVTIVDAEGIALTRAAPAEGAPDDGGARLDAKRAAERYLASKASDVLEEALGRGQAMVSVDATLSYDQARVTTDDVLPAGTSGGAHPTGVIVRQRRSGRDALAAGVPADGSRADAGPVETEYQVGHRTEQIVRFPGAVRRLGVSVVVRPALDAAQLERVRNLVSVAVGLDSKRGDDIAVYSMEQVAGVAKRSEASTPASTAPPVSPSAVRDRAAPTASGDPWQELLPASLAILALALLAALLAMRRLRRAPHQASSPAVLTPAEREALLANVRKWLENKSAGPMPMAEQVRR